MALVCDLQSPTEEVPPDPDLEDGEIEDDEEEAPAEPPQPEPPAPEVEVPAVVPPVVPVVAEEGPKPPELEFKGKKKEKDRLRYEEKKEKYRHMTEAEKSILHLRKREKMMREKWEKQYRKDMRIIDPMEDDFAKNIEKTLATILNKKEKEAAAANMGPEEMFENPEEKRGKKRKKHDKDRKKYHHMESPNSDYDDYEMASIHDGSPASMGGKRSHSPSNSDFSEESEYNSERSREEEKPKKKKHRKRKRKKAKEQVLQDSQGVCIFYLQGKCQKSDCPYSHEANPPMKLELCKFYLMGCCAKGEKCSYMHSEFPCKFYHMGLHCTAGDDCKFSHGKPLSEGLKQILFKHIETAPRDILGGFPRMTREEALNMINVTQRKLVDQYGPGGTSAGDDAKEEPPKEAVPSKRNKPSRWQDPDPAPHFPLKFYGQDQDMRINSNGDIDMRTLPPALGAPLPSSAVSVSSTVSESSQEAPDVPENKGVTAMGDVDIRNTTLPLFGKIEPTLPGLGKDVDIRAGFLDVDIRQLPKEASAPMEVKEAAKEPENLFGKSQDNSNDSEQDKFDVDISNINWYSDDDDDEDRLTIKVEEDEKVKEKDEDEKEEETVEESREEANVRQGNLSPPPIKPLDVVSKLGDLSKIDISAEVTKLLTSMSQNRVFAATTQPNPETLTLSSTTTSASTAAAVNDPRAARQDPRLTAPSTSQSSPRSDPRLVPSDPRNRSSRQNSTDSQEKEKKPEKMSIYEQGSIDLKDDIDDDFRSLRPDIDLRNLTLPFKGMENYTPAKEIDASINSHPPLQWKVVIVDVPRPDYTGLKLSVNDAEKTGDPRLRKIFRLSTEEKDSPMSPKESPKATSAPRVDPRLRKIEENKAKDGAEGQMNYSQQLSMLQSSAFYQSLTTNQKMMLNQELANRTDQTGAHNPVLESLLSNLNLIPGAAAQNNPNIGAAVTILANVNKLNPMQPMMGPMVQPGLLGAAPGIPNMAPEFPMGFDPRAGGLLGNGPPQYGPNNFQPDGGFNQYGGDEYYQEGGGFQHRDNRGFNRDRRRGRNNFNRHGGNRNFRNNRNHNHHNHNHNHRPNRNHSPP